MYVKKASHTRSEVLAYSICCLYSRSSHSMLFRFLTRLLWTNCLPVLSQGSIISHIWNSPSELCREFSIYLHACTCIRIQNWVHEIWMAISCENRSKMKIKTDIASDKIYERNFSHLAYIAPKSRPDGTLWVIEVHWDILEDSIYSKKCTNDPESQSLAWKPNCCYRVKSQVHPPRQHLYMP